MLSIQVTTKENLMKQLENQIVKEKEDVRRLKKELKDVENDLESKEDQL